MFFEKYVFGTTAIYYAEVPIEGHENKTTVGLFVYPEGEEIDVKKLPLDSLVQVAFTGDEALIDYTLGLTMRNRASTVLKVQQQTRLKNDIVTLLTDEKGNCYTHVLNFNDRTGVFKTKVVLKNCSNEIKSLEFLQSFSLSGLLAKRSKTTCGLKLHRMTSAWSRECRLKTDEFTQLGLDMSWARYGVKCEKWGQIGSMPNRNYYPFAAVEDEQANIVWAVTMEAPYSWQMEVYEEKETASLSGGLADFETGHWRKEIFPGESFETGYAYFTVGKTLNDVCNALVHDADSRLLVPKAEEDMPVLFNEYCTTWGCPSEENINSILKAIEPFPIDIFVIDCGWYKPDDKGWCNAIGDWKESRALFPQGIKRVSEKIKSHGKIPGIWFEFEVAGRDSEYFSAKENLLSRDGVTVTAKNRRFLDLRQESVDAYLNERFLKFLKENGFGYLKIDYNDNYGIGCDGAESLGEGGRQIAEASIEWLQKIKDAVPDIIIENCSSGGSRIEPLRMNQVSMCSFSDAHECAEIPLVAANVSRVIPARQMQIWAVLREKETLSRTIYSLCAAFMGRICLSGDVLKLSKEKTACIKKGLAFYSKIKEIVRYGDITLIDNTVQSYREAKGRQVYIKQWGDFRLIIVHFLDCAETVHIPAKGTIEEAFTDLEYSLDKKLIVVGKPYHAAAFLLKK